MKVDGLGGESGGLNNINKKAMDIKKEAEDLLNKASKGIEQLRSEYTKLVLVLAMCSISGLCSTVQCMKNRNRDSYSTYTCLLTRGDCPNCPKIFC